MRLRLTYVAQAQRHNLVLQDGGCVCAAVHYVQLRQYPCNMGSIALP